MNIVVMGGGISGLASAWYLRKKYPEAKITLLEKGDRLGGSIQTVQKEGAYLEIGPRTFAVSRSSHLLQLIEDVGLTNEILFSKKEASKRFLWHGNKLCQMNSFIPMILKGLIRESLLPKKTMEDESIYDYAIRRLNRNIAETILDPMTLGIYSGDIRTLSLRSCYPFLYEWEQNGRSLLKGLFFAKKGGGLFTLKRGMGSLVEAIEQKLDAEIVLNSSVEEITKEGVAARGRFWPADIIISALPCRALKQITNSEVNFSSQSIWVVSCGFKEDILKQKGFGYLIPTKEKESVMGMVWDSAIFSRDTGAYKTILTAMVRDKGDQPWAKSEALSAIRRHLGYFKDPDFIESNLADEAIPQFEVGYAKSLAKFQSNLKDRFPNLFLTGNYLEGASVDACIQSAIKIISIN